MFMYIVNGTRIIPSNIVDNPFFYGETNKSYVFEPFGFKYICTYLLYEQYEISASKNSSILCVNGRPIFYCLPPSFCIKFFSLSSLTEFGISRFNVHIHNDIYVMRIVLKMAILMMTRTRE